MWMTVSWGTELSDCTRFPFRSFTSSEAETTNMKRSVLSVCGANISVNSNSLSTELSTVALGVIKQCQMWFFFCCCKTWQTAVNKCNTSFTFKNHIWIFFENWFLVLSLKNMILRYFTKIIFLSPWQYQSAKKQLWCYYSNICSNPIFSLIWLKDKTTVILINYLLDYLQYHLHLLRLPQNLNQAKMPWLLERTLSGQRGFLIVQCIYRHFWGPVVLESWAPSPSWPCCSPHTCSFPRRRAPPWRRTDSPSLERWIDDCLVGQSMGIHWRSMQTTALERKSEQLLLIYYHCWSNALLIQHITSTVCHDCGLG